MNSRCQMPQHHFPNITNKSRLLYAIRTPCFISILEKITLIQFCKLKVSYQIQLRETKWTKDFLVFVRHEPCSNAQLFKITVQFM